MNERKMYPDSEGPWWFKGERRIRYNDINLTSAIPMSHWRLMYVVKGHQDVINSIPGMYYVFPLTILGSQIGFSQPYDFAGAWIKIEEPKDV